MSNTGDERELWRIGRFSCVMVSCCAGAELQIRESPERVSGDVPETKDGADQVRPSARGRIIQAASRLGLTASAAREQADAAVSQSDRIILRELYPTKSDLYERAGDLRSSYQGQA